MVYEGTYTEEDGAITFEDDVHEAYTGSFDGKVLTIDLSETAGIADVEFSKVD